MLPEIMFLRWQTTT